MMASISYRSCSETVGNFLGASALIDPKDKELSCFEHSDKDRRESLPRFWQMVCPARPNNTSSPLVLSDSESML